MSLHRQSWIGMTLAALILSAWTAVHVYGLFFLNDAHPLVWAGLILLQTWLSVGMYIVAHDAMHGSLFPLRPKVGHVAGAVVLWLYAGFSFREQMPKHHAHHRHSGSADDPDFAPESPRGALRWYRRFVVTYFRGRELLVMALRIGVYLLLGASVSSILLLFALPGILSSFQLFWFGTFLPHRHAHDAPHGGFADHHNARSNNYGYLVSLLTCFHFGYHHEHHLHPGTPWWRLPAMRIRRPG